MKVAELKIGELYKIRSDRPTRVKISNGRLDIHVNCIGHGPGFRIRPMDHIVYLGWSGSSRHVMYRGKKMGTWPNIWRHVVLLEEE